MKSLARVCSARRALAALLSLGVCFQVGSCTSLIANRGFAGGATAGAGGFGAIGRTPATPNFGQPLVQLQPILQPGGIAGRGEPP